MIRSEPATPGRSVPIPDPDPSAGRPTAPSARLFKCGRDHSSPQMTVKRSWDPSGSMAIHTLTWDFVVVGAAGIEPATPRL
jgi:hypothetical protein